MEKMGYKAHFEFWLETVSACSTALHKGRLQKRERCSEAVSVAGLSFPAEAGQNCRELAGHKDVFACVDGKPKPGAAVNCNDIFKTAHTWDISYIVRAITCRKTSWKIPHYFSIHVLCLCVGSFPAQSWIGCSITDLTNHRIEVSSPAPAQSEANFKAASGCPL